MLYLVTRHEAVIDWFKERTWTTFFKKKDHFTEEDIESLNPEETVVGNLPLHLVAKICEKGANYIAIEMDIPREYRGKELTKDDMEKLGAKLQEYKVQKV